MAAEAETLQTRWDMKREIRVPIEKGAFISAPSSFYLIKCQGNTLLTSYLSNNDHNQNSSLLMTPVGLLDCSAWHAGKPSHQQKNQHTKLSPGGSLEALQFTEIGNSKGAHKMSIHKILNAQL